MESEVLEKPKKFPFGRIPKEEGTAVSKDGFKIDPKRRYRFQLIQTFERLKPRDSKTGEISDSVYPPIKMVPNDGIALSNGQMRRWRYIYGYPTIWVDEQTNPVPTFDQIKDEKNDILFRDGNLFVNGTDAAKVMALMIMDEHEAQTNSVTNVPKTFRIVTEEDSINMASEFADNSYKAEEAARNATLEELLPIALMFGINIDDSETRSDIIRKQVVLKARQLPDAFLKNFVNPKTQIKYLVTKAMAKNIISGSNGNLVMVDTGKVLFSVDSSKDVAEQVSALIMANNEEATLLYAQLQKVLS